MRTRSSDAFCLEIISFFFRFAHRERLAAEIAVFDDVAEEFGFLYAGHTHRHTVGRVRDCVQVVKPVDIVHARTGMRGNIGVNRVLDFRYRFRAVAVDGNGVLHILREHFESALAFQNRGHIKHEVRVVHTEHETVYRLEHDAVVVQVLNLRQSEARGMVFSLLRGEVLSYLLPMRLRRGKGMVSVADGKNEIRVHAVYALDAFA